MKAVFSLGRNMRPVIKLEGRGSADQEFEEEFKAISLLQLSKSDPSICPLPIPVEKEK